MFLVFTLLWKSANGSSISVDKSVEIHILYDRLFSEFFQHWHPIVKMSERGLLLGKIYKSCPVLCESPG